MSSRTPVCEDVGTISVRLDELQRAAIGCICERDPHSGVLNHKPECSMGPGLPPETPPSAAFWSDGEPNTVLVASGHDIQFDVELKAKVAVLPPFDEDDAREFADTYATLLADHRRAVADWADEALRRQGR